MGPAGSHAGAWGCPMGLTPPGPSPGVEVGVSCLVGGGPCWVGSRNFSRPWGPTGADPGAQGPQGAAILFPLCSPLPGPMQGPAEGTRGTISCHCRHETVGDTHRRCGALSWGGSRHTARDTRKAWILGQSQDCGFCPPGVPWGWRAGPQPHRGTPAQLYQPLLLPEPGVGSREGSAPL